MGLISSTLLFRSSTRQLYITPDTGSNKHNSLPTHQLRHSRGPYALGVVLPATHSKVCHCDNGATKPSPVCQPAQKLASTPSGAYVLRHKAGCQPVALCITVPTALLTLCFPAFGSPLCMTGMPMSHSMSSVAPERRISCSDTVWHNTAEQSCQSSVTASNARSCNCLHTWVLANHSVLSSICAATPSSCDRMD